MAFAEQGADDAAHGMPGEDDLSGIHQGEVLIRQIRILGKAQGFFRPLTLAVTEKVGAMAGESPEEWMAHDASEAQARLAQPMNAKDHIPRGGGSNYPHMHPIEIVLRYHEESFLQGNARSAGSAWPRGPWLGRHCLYKHIIPLERVISRAWAIRECIGAGPAGRMFLRGLDKGLFPGIGGSGENM